MENLPGNQSSHPFISAGQTNDNVGQVRFSRLVEIFTWAASISGLIIIQFPFAQVLNTRTTYFAVAGLSLFTLIWHHLLPKKTFGSGRQFVYNLVTVFFIALLVHNTGGIQSYAVFFYLLAGLSVAISLGIIYTFAIVLVISSLLFFEALGSPGASSTNLSLALLHSWILLLLVLFGRFSAGQASVSKEGEEKTILEKEKVLGKLKDEFVSIISNKLKQPSTAISGYLESISTQYSSSLTSQTREVVQLAKDNGIRLSNLLEDLLNASKIEEGSLRVNLSDVFLKPIVSDVLSSQFFDAKSKKISLIEKGDADIAAKADTDRLKEVLTNLVSNAIKYTPEGGKVEIEVKDGGEFALVSVTDTGIGISPEDQKHLFEKFYRVENEKTKGIKGSGLGLFITKNLVEKMGGEIGVTSQGQGSTFYFKLPRYRW